MKKKEVIYREDKQGFKLTFPKGIDPKQFQEILRMLEKRWKWIGS